MSDQIPPCAKCSHETFYLVNPFAVRIESGTAPLRVATGLTTPDDDVGTFQLRVCAACGYSELWARDLKELERVAASPFYGNVRAVTVSASYR
jgi:hypothetical protein